MPEAPPAAARPLVAAVDMGYGHLRAAHALASALGEPVVRVDRPPLADAAEQRLWRRVRRAYELTSRLSSIPVVGAPLRWLLDQLTSIPALHPHRDLSRPTRGVTYLDRLLRRGLGGGLVAALRREGRPLLTTFYSPALAAGHHGLPDVHCVVTDSDVNRIWAPRDPARSRVRYLVPTPRCGRRLRAYGVPAAHITCTGFPLPPELLGGPALPALRRNLAARLVRLDREGVFRAEHGAALAAALGPLPAEEEGRPPLLTYAVGGAGAQAGLPRLFLPSLRGEVLGGRLRVALVAGARPRVRDALARAVERAGLAGAPAGALELLFEPDLDAYFARMNALLAGTDVLWTKPSELCFFAALGLPLVCAAPVGAHERLNRRWIREAGAGFKQRDPRWTADWLGDLLDDGALAAAAWAGYLRLPKHGLYRILEAMGPPGAGASERSP